MASKFIPTPEWFSDRESIIKAVHKLPEYPVEYAPSVAKTRYVGKYDTTNPFTDRIYVSRYSETPNLTFAHETGHRVEIRGLATSSVVNEEDLPSWSDPELRDWFKAVNASKAMDRMTGLFQEADTDDNVATISAIQYYTRPQELWARSYAQYIVIKSQDSAMLEELDHLQYLIRNGYRLPTQWQNKDFEPIMKAIDDLFTRKGWKP